MKKIGNQVQAIGNSTIIAEMLIPFSEETKQLLNIKGNWLQAFGGGISLGDDLGHKISLPETLSDIGNILQIIGNSLQAIGGIYELEKNNENNEQRNINGKSLDVIGSWIQAVGSVISAIGQTKETLLEKNKKGSSKTDGN